MLLSRGMWTSCLYCFLFFIIAISVLAVLQPAAAETLALGADPQIAADVKYYAGLGMHRAGSRIDRRTAAWLKKRLQQMGWTVTQESFSIRRPISRNGMVSMKSSRTGSRVLPGMPLLNAAPTSSTMKSTLGFLGEAGRIPVIHIFVTATAGTPALRSQTMRTFKQAVASGRYPAVIGITQGGMAGLAPLFVDLDRHYQTPALLLGSQVGNEAEIAAKINRPVRFRTQVRYEKVRAYNLIGKREGTDPKAAPIVVVAPRSAWWSAAAERGTGVASMLSIAKTITTGPPLKHTVYLVFTTGQEYYSLGLKQWLKQHSDWSYQVHAWVYLAANLGTRPTPHYMLQASSDAMRRVVGHAFLSEGIGNVRWLDQAPLLVPAWAPAFYGAAYSVVMAADNNRCERLTCDRWPSAVNVEATDQFAKALARVLHELDLQ